MGDLDADPIVLGRGLERLLQRVALPGALEVGEVTAGERFRGDAVHVAGGRVGGEHLADVRRLAFEHEDRVGRLREERRGALLALAERPHRLVALGGDGADEERGQRADGERRLDQQRLALAGRGRARRLEQHVAGERHARHDQRRRRGAADAEAHRHPDGDREGQVLERRVDVAADAGEVGDHARRGERQHQRAELDEPRRRGQRVAAIARPRHQRRRDEQAAHARADHPRDEAAADRRPRRRAERERGDRADERAGNGGHRDGDDEREGVDEARQVDAEAGPGPEHERADDGLGGVDGGQRPGGVAGLPRPSTPPSSSAGQARMPSRVSAARPTPVSGQSHGTCVSAPAKKAPVRVATAATRVRPACSTR